MLSSPTSLSTALCRLPSPTLRHLSTSNRAASRIRKIQLSHDKQQFFEDRTQIKLRKAHKVLSTPGPLIIRKHFTNHLINRRPDEQSIVVPETMSDMQKIHTDKAFPVAAPYSQAIVAGGTIYVSGQIPGTADGKLVEGNIGDKTAACCKNIIAILEAAGSSIERVVKVNIFLDDMANFKEMNETYGVYFAHKPARSCVAVKALPLGVPVEIECIALAGKSSSL